MTDLEQIKSKLNLVDIIGETVALKKAGRHFKGLCPFHTEKTPSFIVSPDRQIWKCFGCNKGGDIFTYLMETESLEFPEALKLLAGRAGVTLETTPLKSPLADQRERLKEIHQLAQEYYQYLLTKHGVGERARLYLKQRGVTDALINTFSLGFAPLAWDNLGKFLINKKYGREDLLASGLVLAGRVGLYDRFRDRIIFSLKNHRGETIAFSGRVLTDTEKEAKYINSPETVLYTKGDTLYGIHLTKDSIRKANNCVVVEGEFDVISSYAAGVTNVVAIKGSALTQAQVNLLKRYTDTLTLALDADLAGVEASRRGIDIADKAGFTIKVATIPLGKDPDESARESPHLWKQAIVSSVAYFDFLISSAEKMFGTQESYDKKRFSDEVLPVIAKIDNPIVQAHYVKLIAQKLNLGEENINEAMKRIRLPFIKQKPEAKNISVQTGVLLEEYLLSLIIQSLDPGAMLQYICKNFDPSDLPVSSVRKIFLLFIDYHSQNEKFKVAQFGSSLPEELVTTFDSAFLVDLSHIPQDSWVEEIDKTLLHLKRSLFRRKIKLLTAQIDQAEGLHDEKTVHSLGLVLNTVTASLKQLL